MKIRNGFVSNSSSSSFIIRDKALRFYTTDEDTDKYYRDEYYGYNSRSLDVVVNNIEKDINDFCFKLTDEQKSLIEQIPVDQKQYDWYLTPFICECDPSYFYDKEFVIEYNEGGHGLPYSEHNYDIVLQKDRYNSVYLLKDHNIGVKNEN